MYTTVNFKTKKALKEAVAAGKKIGVFQPGPFGNGVPVSGIVSVEGPHYPEHHRWYANVTLQNNVIVKVSQLTSMLVVLK